MINIFAYPMHMLVENSLGALGTVIMDRISSVLDDLSPSAATLLLALLHDQAKSTTGLAALAGVSQPTAVRVLDGLGRRRFVTRGRRRGRETPIRLTPEGRARATAIQDARLQVLGDLLNPLSFEEMAALQDLVGRILWGATTSRRFARHTCRFCAHDICTGDGCPVASATTDRAPAISATEDAKA